jgi:predicted DNA-binding WGR domain protein
MAAKKTAAEKAKAKPKTSPPSAGHPAGTAAKSASPEHQKQRRFECTKDGASKFWEIVRTGNDVVVHFGKIGADGQEKTKSFDSEPEAVKEYDQLVREKTSKGYVEVAPPKSAAPGLVEAFIEALKRADNPNALNGETWVIGSTRTG